MITKSQIKWGRYENMSGPYFTGTIPYKLPEDPSFLDKCIAIVSSVEGKIDAVNMYDSCVVSIGMLQVCERFNLVSNLLGKVANECGINAVLDPLSEALQLSNATFKKTQLGNWRFHFLDSRGVVDTVIKKKELFLAGAGTDETWTPQKKDHALTWAVGLANIWENPRAQQAQIEYIKNIFMSFVLKESRQILFTDSVELRSFGIVGALRAVFISFAINNPMKANEALIKHNNECQFKKWSYEWCVSAMKMLAYNPNIAIYQKRYNRIRPLVEELFNVSLPKDDKELEAWRVEVKQEKIEEEIISYLADEEVVLIEPKDNERKTNKIKETIIPENSKPSIIGFIVWLFSLITKLFKGKQQ